MSGRDPLQMISFPTEVLSRILSFVDYRSLRRESATKIQARCRGVLDREAIRIQLAWMTDEEEEDESYPFSDDYDSEEEEDWSLRMRLSGYRYREMEVASPRGNRWS